MKAFLTIIILCIATINYAQDIKLKENSLLDRTEFYEGADLLGYSKKNKLLERIEYYEKVPSSMQEKFAEMVDRSYKYFQVPEE